jgi:hypothetical protein
MAFETYTPAVKAKANKAKRSKTFGFSPRTNKLVFYTQILEKYFQDKQYVHLLYDKDEKLIAIQPVEKDDVSALKLLGKEDRAKYIFITRFLNHYEIKLTQSSYQFKEQDGMLVLKVG